MARNSGAESNPGGFDEGGGQGGQRGGSGESWASAGLSFDTKGIKDFTAEMKKAAAAVKEFWAPFKDTSVAEKKTNAFFANVKKQMAEINAAGGGLAPVGGGEDHRQPAGGGNGGNSRITNPAARRRLSMEDITGAFGAGRSGYRDARNPEIGDGRQSAAGAIWQGVRIAGGGKGMGAAGWAAAGYSAVHMAEAYVDRNAQPAQALQSAGNWAIQSQSMGTRGWSTGYRDKMAETLARQGLAPGMQGGFIGREDVAGATNIAMRAGLQVTQGGQGKKLNSNFKQAGALALLTGGTGTEGMSLLAGMQGPEQTNMMRMMGIQVSPGGKPQDIMKTYQAMRNYIFGPLGRKPTKDEVRMTLRTPGTPSYALLQQIFGGDEQQIDAFVRWVEASSPASVGGESKDITGIKDLEKLGVTGTTAARKREGMAAGEKRRAEADKGMLRGIEQATGVTESFNEAMGAVNRWLGPFGDALEDAVGFLGEMGNTLPGHSGGGQGGGLLSGAVHSLIMGQAIRGMFGRGGGGPGPGPVPPGGGMGGLSGLLGPGLQAGLGKIGLGGLGRTLATRAAAGIGGGSMLAGGALALGSQVGGELIAHLGGTGPGGKRWLARDAGTMTKWAGTGAAIGSVVPGVGTAIGAGIGGVAGGIHTLGRHLGIFGDPTPPYGRMPTAAWYRGGIGDPEAAENAGDATGAMDLRGPGRVQGMNADFVQRLAKMFTDNPKLSLTSGFRTRAEQERLYREKPNLAAKPGHSKHEKGLAADIGPASEYGWIAANIDKYGLGLPMPSKEPWHVQPSGGVAGGAVAAAESPSAGGEDAGSGGGGGGGMAAGAGGMSGPDIMGMGNFIPLAGKGSVASGSKGKRSAASTGAMGGSTAGGAAGQPTGNATQQEVMQTILRVGRSMGADPQVLLAAFETGWVESNMTNLHGGDRDSQGVFQQRPSQGWGTVEEVTNVEHAAKSFFTRAMGSKYKNGKGTAGQMAQDVQRSGFPKRYDENRAKAVASLAGLGVDVSGVGDPVGGMTQKYSINVGQPQGAAQSIVIHNLTIPVQIARGTPDEAENAARTIGSILTNRDRILEIARG